jgi:putative transcriptional regulator
MRLNFPRLVHNEAKTMNIWDGVSVFGLGKRRSSFGEFLAKNNIKQEEISKVTGLNRDTVSDVCTDPEYQPRKSTINLLLMAVRQISGKKVDKRDFWGL